MRRSECRAGRLAFVYWLWRLLLLLLLLPILLQTASHVLFVCIVLF
jgi:hypothetical protein